MKSAVSRTLITSLLLLPALPAAAQPRQLPASQLSNWSRVRTIIPGSRIRAVYVGRRQDHQYFISATDDTMTVLTPERLPRSARKTAIAIAETQPGLFTAATWMEFTDGSVRVTPDGVFVKGPRVAAIEDIVTTVGRHDVAEVSQDILVPPPRHAMPATGLDPDAQVAAAGGVGGAVMMLAICKENCPEWALAATFVGPLIAVAAIRARHRERVTELVYLAP